MINYLIEKFFVYTDRIFLKKHKVKELHSSESMKVSKGYYLSSIKKILRNKKKFKKFKNNKTYQIVLEHVSKDEGRKYLDYMKKCKFGKYLIKNINLNKINDRYGEPKKFFYSEVGMISPSTLRYLATMVDIYNTFGRKNFLKIVEVGVGYGGQYLCMDNVFKIKKYFLFDHNIVNKLVKKYLDLFNINSKYEILSIEDEKKINNIDLFLSNHAFSELNINLQRIYINKYIKNSKNGYMIMNSGKKNSLFNQNHLNLTELKKYLPKFKIKKEFIDQNFNNYIIYWKQK